MALELIDGYLYVVEAGYAWKKTSTGDSVLAPNLLRSEWAHGGEVSANKWQSPVLANKNLFLEFARLQESENGVDESAVCAFANQYGLLSGWCPHYLQDPDSGESLKEWQNEIHAMWKAVSIYQAMKRDNGAELTNYLYWYTRGVNYFYVNPQYFGKYPQTRDGLNRSISEEQWKNDQYQQRIKRLSELTDEDRAEGREIFKIRARYHSDVIVRDQIFSKQWDELKAMKEKNKQQLEGRYTADNLAVMYYCQNVINEKLAPSVAYLNHKHFSDRHDVELDTPAYIRVLMAPKDNSFHLHMHAVTLRGVLWLQFANWITGEQDYKECNNAICKKWFAVGGANRPKNAKYCSKRCQQQAANRRNCPTTRTDRQKGKKNRERVVTTS